MKGLTFFLLLLLGVRSISIAVPARETRCFKESAAQGQNVGLMFHVVRGGSLDVDLKITSPSNEVVYNGLRETEGKYNFQAAQGGDFEFCFGNEMSLTTAKLVAFEVSTDGARPGVRSVQEQREQLNQRLHKLQQEVAALDVAVNAVQADTVYTKQREEAHRNTNESTNGRILWWSVFELIVVGVLSLVQVYFIRTFFEKR